jgi:hypothetical protein|tara:strand:- start:77 stop:502 length:426 start_codon:yes stop_codon:yes gene_type:complete
MATINANISVTSTIPESGFSLNKTMTMTKAGNTTGIENTNGLSVKKLSATTAVVLELAADATASGANKLYIRNTGSNKAEHVKISFNASGSTDTTDEAIGRLYGGDWMLIPWEADGATHNIVAAPSTADEVTTIEYMTFHE